jgi:hypothetical protein
MRSAEAADRSGILTDVSLAKAMTRLTSRIAVKVAD